MADASTNTPAATSVGPRFTLEVCVEGPDHALAAERGGADRIELCAALTEGGVTPGAGLLAFALARLSIPVFVLIRARRGDFVYGEAEAEVMVDDVRRARAMGAHGVVVGALTPVGDVDRPLLGRLREAAGPLPLTFHRAFDHARDRAAALEVLIEEGATRVLTSGGRAAAPEAIPELGALVRQAAGRIVVMPGGGIRAGHVGELVRRTGAREVHASASSWGPSPARPPDHAYPLASAPRSDLERRVVSPSAVREYADALRAAATDEGFPAA